MGIEPTALAWEARVLPLYDARFSPLAQGQARIVRVRAGRAQAGMLDFGPCLLAPDRRHGAHTMPHITLNGETRNVLPACTLADLLVELELAGKRLAVECNGEIVPRGQHASTVLAEGDALEIVVAVGGG